MKKLRNHLIGVDQGDIALFSDFEEGGEMWTGIGPRERRRIVRFSEPYRRPPSVSVSVSLWDVDTKGAIRVDVSAQAVTKDSFDAVFKTWGDSRIARCRITWMAIGELQDDDDWELA